MSLDSQESGIIQVSHKTESLKLRDSTNLQRPNSHKEKPKMATEAVTSVSSTLDRDNFNTNKINSDDFEEDNSKGTIKTDTSEIRQSSHERTQKQEKQHVEKSLSETSEISAEAPSSGVSEFVEASQYTFENKGHFIPPYISHSNFKYVSFSSLPGQVVNKNKRSCFELNIMVAGAVGTGKTSFMNMAFDTDLATGEEPLSTNAISVHTYLFEEGDYKIKLRLTDTPGLGSAIDNKYAWVPLIDYIDDQFRSRLLQEEQPDRRRMSDARVSHCFYFISPTGQRVSQLDIKTMKEISLRTSLFPIIAKADTFSSESLSYFKTKIREALRENDIQICDKIQCIPLVELINSNMPFAIISSNTLTENKEGKLVKGRKYKWGVAEVENDDHCDYNILKEIIFSSHLVELSESVEYYYEDFRNRLMKYSYEKAFNERSIKEGNFHSSCNGGLERYSDNYHVFYEEVKKSFYENSPILFAKQERLKEKYYKQIVHHEKRFREWKKALVEKQKELNHEIKELHKKSLKLQENVDALASLYELEV